jgi:hypothetical protein
MSQKDDYLQRRVGESVLEYQERLNTVCAGYIGLLEACEKAANLQRFRELLPLSQALSEEDSEAVRRVKELILRLQEEVEWYESRHAELTEVSDIQQRKETLDLLIS